MSFEARAGGQLVERQPDGASILWFSVLYADPGKALDLVGYLTPSFGGPATTMIRWELVADGDATVLRTRDALFGRVDAESAADMEKGWQRLLGEGLKPYAER